MLALYNGSQVMGYMGDNSVPTTYQDGTAGSFDDVTVGTSVTVTYNGSRITKMVINTTAPKKEEVKKEEKTNTTQVKKTTTKKNSNNNKKNTKKTK